MRSATDCTGVWRPWAFLLSTLSAWFAREAAIPALRAASFASALLLAQSLRGSPGPALDAAVDGGGGGSSSVVSSRHCNSAAGRYEGRVPGDMTRPRIAAAPAAARLPSAPACTDVVDVAEEVGGRSHPPPMPRWGRYIHVGGHAQKGRCTSSTPYCFRFAPCPRGVWPQVPAGSSAAPSLPCLEVAPAAAGADAIPPRPGSAAGSPRERSRGRGAAREFASPPPPGSQGWVRTRPLLLTGLGSGRVPFVSRWARLTLPSETMTRPCPTLHPAIGQCGWPCRRADTSLGARA